MRPEAWLDRYIDEDLPPSTVLMAMIRDAGERDALTTLLRDNAGRAPALAALWEAHPEAWDIVRGVLAEVDHDASAGDTAAAVAAIAAGFDRAAGVSETGSVALYALGDPTLLAAATAEVVERLDAWGLLRPPSRVLDLGCGIGRFAAALAPRVAGVIGLDVSPAMVSAARRTCASFGNVEIRQGDGLGLGEIAGGSLDLVLAVDSFPYLVQAGGTLAADHVASAARALVPGGTLAILNYSYRGDPARDREDLARLAARSGLALRSRETLGLQHWDAEAFLLDRT